MNFNMVKCNFSERCNEEIEEWKTYCRKHEEFIDDVESALDCIEQEKAQRKYDRENPD